MVLSGMTNEQNYEAALLFAHIAKMTAIQKYKEVSLDFLNLLYLRGFLTGEMVNREPTFAILGQEPRWQQIVSQIKK